MKRQVPAGAYVVMRAQGGYDRPLFDQLISDFFTEILPQNPQLSVNRAFFLEILRNGQPQNAEVEVRIPLN